MAPQNLHSKYRLASLMRRSSIPDRHDTLKPLSADLNGFKVAKSALLRMEEAFMHLPGSSLGDSLHLLEVCKQIHREAALLPYELNTFAIRALEDLPLLASRLSSDQLSAIRRLEITLYGMPWFDNLSVITFESMGGLERVSFLAFLHSSEVGPDAILDLSDPKDQDTYMDDITRMRNPSLKVAQIRIAAPKLRQGQSVWTENGSLKESLKQWRSRAEEKLLDCTPFAGELTSDGESDEDDDVDMF